MRSVGTIIGLLIALFLGPYGIALLVSLIFGLVLSNHMKFKKVNSDLQEIKRKLGIQDEETIILELQEEQLSEEQHENIELGPLTELDYEIEQELEEYSKHINKDTK